MSAQFSIEKVRSQFPALKRTYKGKQVVYFDGPGGSQVLQTVIDAISSYMARGGGNLHGQFPSSVETEEHLSNARQAVADLLGASSDEVAFGQNSTSLAFSIARSLSKTWGSEDNIVVTEMDHRCNVDSWVSAANDKGVDVRFIPVDEGKLTLDLSDLGTIITSNTKLVAVTLASNAVGTITDMRKIKERAEEVGAIVVIDAVHAVPHIAINRDELGADILLCSAYKFFGPHVGIAVVKKDLFEKLQVYKLNPAPTYIPDKLETGTQNHEALAAIPAVVEFIASFGNGSTVRERIVSGFDAIGEHEDKLATKLRDGLSKHPTVTLYQADKETRKTPTIAFTINGFHATDVCKWLAEEHSIFTADGHFYATTLAEKLGINQMGGWIRVGLAPYNSEEEVNRFLEAIDSLVSSKLSV
ncbi:cysteine desulfurase-like protein [Bacillus luteolus]|uniref:Cysteine desulfurase-like protein n=1 Tax=Litchfieldia luteola TaxID=682179 RepID=A0ABR9QGJ6_9BACI|nr:cysteine desulfurase-like protein [Cytobacillus luteolus]MBE4907614.1 cysteine desulfurase-like protein [Cytobacillus luteolus]MBP1941065.1 cysteine desulfurase family protein (TIGR01976 family) [Cytobacillus luteolus]